MAYETFATIKQYLANRLGKTNDTTAETLRDNAINQAIKQIYHDARFGWLLKKATLSITGGVANMPSDFSVDLGVETAFSSISGTANDHIYNRVALKDADNYTTADYIYWLTWDATNKVFVFNTNQTTDTVTLYYYYQPADLSSSTDTTLIPDVWAIVDLATAIWWLGAERDEAEYDRFYAKYQERLANMRNKDGAFGKARRPLSSLIDTESETSILATRR